MRWFSVLGPLIAALGAALLSYDIFRGPVRWYLFSDFPRHRREAEKRLHERTLESHRALPSTVYTDAQKQDLINHELQNYQETLRKDDEEIALAEKQERDHSLKLGGYGFLLVAVGSLMQALGAFFAK